MNLSIRHLSCLLLCAASFIAGAAPAWAAGANTNPVRSGQSIYSSRCSSCHDYAMRGAPRLTDKAAWTHRLAQGQEKLYEHVIKGLGWMPRRGACSTCTDDELKAAVDYMLSRIN